MAPAEDYAAGAACRMAYARARDESGGSVIRTGTAGTAWEWLNPWRSDDVESRRLASNADLPPAPYRRRSSCCRLTADQRGAHNGPIAVMSNKRTNFDVPVPAFDCLAGPRVCRDWPQPWCARAEDEGRPPAVARILRRSLPCAAQPMTTAAFSVGLEESRRWLLQVRCFIVLAVTTPPEPGLPNR